MHNMIFEDSLFVESFNLLTCKRGYIPMGYNSFNKVLSPLITKRLYNNQLYYYLKDKELTHDFNSCDLLENNDKKTDIE